MKILAVATTNGRVNEIHITKEKYNCSLKKMVGS